MPETCGEGRPGLANQPNRDATQPEDGNADGRTRTADLRVMNPTQPLQITGNAEGVQQNRQRDDDLAEVVAAWDSRPPAMRAGVVAIVRAARGG